MGERPQVIAFESSLLNAISDVDAILTVDGSSLNLKEFFPLLSSTGLAYRRCELVRVKAKNKKKKPGAKSKQDALVGS